MPYNASGAAAAPMNALVAACKKRGLLPFVNMNRLHVVPPCTVTDGEARLGLDLLDDALGEVEAQPYVAVLATVRSRDEFGHRIIVRQGLALGA